MEARVACTVCVLFCLFFSDGETATNQMPHSKYVHSFSKKYITWKTGIIHNELDLALLTPCFNCTQKQIVSLASFWQPGHCSLHRQHVSFSTFNWYFWVKRRYGMGNYHTRSLVLGEAEDWTQYGAEENIRIFFLFWPRTPLKASSHELVAIF